MQGQIPSQSPDISAARTPARCSSVYSIAGSGSIKVMTMLAMPRVGWDHSAGSCAPEGIGQEAGGRHAGGGRGP